MANYNHLDAGGGIGTETFRLDDVFPPDDLRFDTEQEYCLYTILPFISLFL